MARARLSTNKRRITILYLEVKVKKYQIYFLKSLALPALSIAICLTLIVWLSQSLKILALISNSGFGLMHFVELSALLMPFLLGLILPISNFIAILYIYYKLLNNREIIILESAGLSRLQIALPALILSLLMTLFCYFISLYLMPIAHSKYRDSLAYYRENFAAIYLEEGVFNNIVKNITIYLDEYQDNGDIKGILVHDQRNKNHITTIFAESGSIKKVADFIRFTFYNGNRQEIDEHAQLSILNFSHFNYDLPLKSAQKQIRAKELEELKLSSLLKNKNIPILRKKKISTELNQRLCWPLYNILLGIIALLGVLPAEFKRAGNGKRIVINITFAIVCILAYFITSNLALDHLAINLMPFFLLCIFIALSSYLLFKETT